MFDVFLNDVSQGHAVLPVHFGQAVDDTISQHLLTFNEKNTLLSGEIDLAKLLQLLNNDAQKVMISPDDQPPLPPRLYVGDTFPASKVIVMLDGDPPISPKFLTQMPKPMADPNGDPPRPPK